ncbi:MAG TPA: LytR C-terminal domain-containing protein [Propionibacteriaceae bacterium]|nr:LytR C-terminal domain-containing protein [Propionibacteriaceae bacterium]
MIGRIFRVVRTPVTLLILFGMLLYGAWWGYNNIIKPIPPLPPEPCVDQVVEKGQLKSAQVVVRVYNGGDRKGLAADVGRSLRGKGFRVVLTTNTVEKIQKTVIVGADGNNPEVLFVKSFFKEAIVRSDKRVDRTVDVLVGNKYGGFNKGARTTYQVDTRTLCLPSQSPSPSPALGG